MDHIQKRIIKIYACILGLGGLYTLELFTLGYGIPCYFREVTGYMCPGCGTSTMMLAFMRLDFASAFVANPVAFFAFPAWVLISVLVFIGRPAAIRREKVMLRCLYVTIAAYMVQFVIRFFLAR